jgi:Zn-dependent protease/CBS domain-containing protein
MSRGLRVGRIAGVEVVADWSLLIIFTLVAVSLGAGTLPGWHPDWSPALIWSVAIVAAVAFFASVLAHELSHALVARGRGVPVDQITLFLFGGVAHMRREPARPIDELAIAAVGPITSIALGVGFTVVGAVLGADALRDGSDVAGAAQRLGPAATMLLWLGPINIALGVFNLIPGFPLDGGRVLRAAIWWITGDLGKATRWASRGGQLVAYTLMTFGAFLAFAGNPFQGLWFVLIGWFLNNAAMFSRQQHASRAALGGVPVSTLMQPSFDHVSPATTVDRLVDDHLMRGTQRAFPVLVAEKLVGMISLDDVRRAPRDRWRDVRVAEMMTPIEGLATIGPDDPAADALERLGERDVVGQLPVIDQRGELVGLLFRDDIVRWLAHRAELRRATMG